MRKFGSSYTLSAEIAGDSSLRKAASSALGAPQHHLYKESHRAVHAYQRRPGYLYVTNRAISSRTNDNYDTFLPDCLRGTDMPGAAPGEYGYLTFVGKPVFVNHANSNHRRMRGVNVSAVLHEDQNPDGSPDTWVEVLKEIDAKKFPKLAQAILNGWVDRTSMGCFLQGTPITLADGTQKPIETIAVGDEVLTHTGKTEAVLYTMKRPYSGLIYSISSYGESSKLLLTPEHPVWIKRIPLSKTQKVYRGLPLATTCLCGRQFTSNHSLGAHIRQAKKNDRLEAHGEPSDDFIGWVKAEDVRAGDWVLTPHVQDGAEVVIEKSAQDCSYTKLFDNDDQGLWRQVTNLQALDFSGHVYNFDVDGDDSYVASDVAVHNCDIVFSKCSKCGNIAHTDRDYCESIPTYKGVRYETFDTRLGKVTGVITEICSGGKFFEDSLLVEPPADPTARVLAIESARHTASQSGRPEPGRPEPSRLQPRRSPSRPPRYSYGYLMRQYTRGENT